MTIAKVYYYPAAGRANMIRLALAASGIEFEDVFPAGGFPASAEDLKLWREIGGNTTTNVPMLQMPDGKVYTQSNAVLKAVGRMGGLMPTDDYDLYLVDKLIMDAADLKSDSYKGFVIFGAPPEAADKYINVSLPKHLGNFERQLAENEYFVSSSLTVADICVYDAVTIFGENIVPGALDNFPKMKDFVKRVSEEPKIAAYLSSAEYDGINKFTPAALGK